jgi:hypothetical protein
MKIQLKVNLDLTKNELRIKWKWIENELKVN